MLAYTSSFARRYLSRDARRWGKAIVDRAFFAIGSISGAKNAENTVVLSFDDGPDAFETPRLLNLLRKRRVRATFFLLSEKAVSQDAIVRQIRDQGHEIGLHFDRHERVTSLSISLFSRRLRAARRQLEQIAGPVRWFRPPFGSQSLTTFLFSRLEGLDVVVWGPYAADWEEQTPEAAAARVLATVRGGDIVLLHDGLELPAGQTPPTFDRLRMVELILDGLEKRRLMLDSVGGMLSRSRARRSAWFRT